MDFQIHDVKSEPCHSQSLYLCPHALKVLGVGKPHRATLSVLEQCERVEPDGNSESVPKSSTFYKIFPLPCQTNTATEAVQAQDKNCVNVSLFTSTFTFFL